MDNTLHQLLLNRHSIRKYKDQPIDPESVKLIIEAALLAPSSKSGRPWQFVVVEDRDVLETLATCKKLGAKPIAGAQLAVAVCVEPAKSDVWIEDASVAASYMQLQAAALGVGSCWIQLRMRDSEDGLPAQQLVQKTLGIPADMQVPVIVTFGISDENRRPVDPAKLLWEKVHIGTWKESE